MDADEPLICNVNDHEAARYVITRMIRLTGLTVVEADTGAHALTVARRDRPAVMVVDLRLPDIDGHDVCRRLKADPATAAIAVVLTSASFAASETCAHGLAAGADAILAQPFTEDELLATVRSLLRLRQPEVDRQRRPAADELLVTLGHELRDPLAAVTGALAVLASRPARDPAEQRARDIARRQTGRLTQVVDRLLDMSRVTRGAVVPRRERLDLRELVGDAVDMAEKTCPNGHDRKFSRALPPRPVVVDGDRALLARALAGLLDHATRCAGPGGAVDVALAVEAGDAVVRVRDDGPGLAPDALGGIFGRSHRSAAPLGRPADDLSLAHALVELHDGTLVARSDGPDRGTTREVRLPVVATAPAPASVR